MMTFGGSDSPNYPPNPHNQHRQPGGGGFNGNGGGGGGHAAGAGAVGFNSSLRSVESDDFSAMDSPVHPEVNKVVFAVDLETESEGSGLGLGLGLGMGMGGGGGLDSLALPGGAAGDGGKKKTVMDELDEDFMDAILEEDA